MYVVRVSTVEQYRKWRQVEGATLAELFDVQETEAMRVGTALHSALEKAVPGRYEEIESNGYRFRFECDCDIPAMQIREFRSSKQYGILRVSGQCDGIIGNTVYDYKTTANFNAERYLDGFQWKYYMDIFGVDKFVWLVFVVKESEGVHVIRDFHRLEARRYAGLSDDCMRLALEMTPVVVGRRSAEPLSVEKTATAHSGVSGLQKTGLQNW